MYIYIYTYMYVDMIALPAGQPAGRPPGRPGGRPGQAAGWLAGRLANWPPSSPAFCQTCLHDHWLAWSGWSYMASWIASVAATAF